MKEIRQIWHLEIFHIIESFQIKKGKYDMSEICLFQFSKNTCGKIKFTK